MVYGGHVLLTGDAPTEEAKAQATAIAQSIENVKAVTNQLTVGPAADFSTRSNDTWLTSKVKTALINTKYVPSGTISVTTSRGVVYLMGKVTQAEGDYAANAAAGVGGVARVVKLFETISREEAIRLSGSGTKSGEGSSDGTAAQKAPIESGAAPAGSGSNGVEAIPIK
ncbi:transport lipoprotein [Bordetella pertussis]|nr:transport lipoprotein [Bordetella pertussis]